MSAVTFGGLPNLNLSATPTIDLGSDAGSTSFSDVLKNAVDSVNAVHDSANAQVTNYLQSGNGDINDVMVAVEKADVSFQLMMQVRNKIVNAYQDIEKMQF